jgi:glycosyltransferase involved in cell wall biosynthesis
LNGLFLSTSCESKKEHMPFSVLMSVYKGENPLYFRLALESIVNQSLQPNQVVIVEDGPLGVELKCIILEFSQLLTITSVVFTKNFGLAVALNKGLEHCLYDIIVRMDSDDICADWRFSSLLEYLETNPSIDILGSNARLISDDGSVVGKQKYPSNITLNSMRYSSSLCHPSVAFYKSKIISVGGYDSNLSKSQDWDLWIRCIQSGMKIKVLQRDLIDFRITGGSVERRKFEQEFNRIILRRYFSFSSRFLPMLRSYIISAMPKKMAFFILKCLKGI